MEISLREWLVIGGVVVIALIIIDGWRRVRGNRNSLRMDLDRKMRDLPDEEPAPSANPELPYGGARPLGEQSPSQEPALERKAPAPRSHKVPVTGKNAHSPASGASERIEPTFGGHSTTQQARRPESAEFAVASAQAAVSAAQQKQKQKQAPPQPKPKPAPESAPGARAVTQPVASPAEDPDPLFAEGVEDFYVLPDAAPAVRPIPWVPEPEETDGPSPERPFSLPASKPKPHSAREKAAQPASRSRFGDLSDTRPEFIEDEYDERSAAGPDFDALRQQNLTTDLPLDDPSFDAPQSHPLNAGETDPLFEDLPLGPSLDLEKPVPLLMERARRPRDPNTPLRAQSRSAGEQPSRAQAVDVSSGAPVASKVQGKGKTASDKQQDLLFGAPADDNARLSSGATGAQPQRSQLSSDLPDPEHVLVITVVSGAQEGFPGAVLHKILKACDLHLGDMDIFLRHEEGSDSGPVQFSMANGVNPGTFDLETVDQLRTPAVTFFMSMEEPRDVMNAFECMLATAETVARHLDGDLLDENHSVLRPQTKEHYRQRIRDYEMHNRSRRGGGSRG